MGKHTAYWRAYARNQGLGAAKILLVILLGVAAAALVALNGETLGVAFPLVMAAIAGGTVLAIVSLATGAYRVVCPECGGVYRRGKWGGSCPTCGLGLLQEDPAPRL